jgi:DeoR/GlpR family transcriptional regulator of sugar metabolism
MLQAERLQAIRELAEKEDIISWERLMQMLNVSKATIRRDVNQLAAEGCIEKTRGGILSLQSDALEPSLQARNVQNTSEKKRIAQAALEYIHPDDFIFFDSGSTVKEITPLIPSSLRFSAMTYDLYIALELSKKPGVDVFITGGTIRKHFETAHGYMTERDLQEFHAQTAFMGADAIRLNSGIHGYNMNDIRPKQIMIENSDQTILLCDHTKFEKTAYIHISELKKIDRIITGVETEEKYGKAIRELGIQVQYV